MEILDKITVKGLLIAQKHGLVELPENKVIPFCEEIIEDFIRRQIADLTEFQSLEQFINTENLFSRAALYTYGKGAELALSHYVSKPLERIGYNFHDCMKSTISANIPTVIINQLNQYSLPILEMYSSMYNETRVNQELFINAGISFNDCLFKILNAVFFMGKKVVLSLEMNEIQSMDLTNNTLDVPYDYDSYSENYNYNVDA